jgi:hypothetical protein
VPRLSAESSGGSSEHSRILKALAITACGKREAFAQERISDGRDPSIVLGRQADQILRQDTPALLHFHYPATAKGSAAIGSLTGRG